MKIEAVEITRSFLISVGLNRIFKIFQFHLNIISNLNLPQHLTSEKKITKPQMSNIEATRKQDIFSNMTQDVIKLKGEIITKFSLQF